MNGNERWEKKIAAGAAVLALVGAAIFFRGAAKAGLTSARSRLERLFAPPPSSPAASSEARAGERRVLYYQDPMHPAYKSDHPGIAPDCGMRLAPVYAPEGAMPSAARPAPQEPADHGPVEMSPAQEHLLGVTTARAEYRRLEKTIRTVGRVDIDETRIVRVHTRVTGWIQKVFVDYTWQHAKKGDPLFTIYSPEVVASEQEYLLALKSKGSLGASPFQEVAAGASSLVEAARLRLLLWDISEDQINEIERSGEVKRELVLYSPITGHVMERKAFPNQYVTPDMELYTVVDHTNVWVIADIYESEIGFVQLGQNAELTLDSYPGRVFRGKLTYIWPHLETETRTLKVRMEFPNPDLRLKPEMFGHVEIKIPLGRRLVVPDSAVFDSGTRQMVFVQTAPGSFQPRAVKLGFQMDGYAEVFEGVKPREVVASSATFLIDSESQLRAALAGMTMSTGVTEIGGRPAPSNTPSPVPAARLQIDFRTMPAPPRLGKNDVVVSVRDETGKPVDGATVSVVFFMPAMPSMGMAAMRSEAALNSVGAGQYRGEMQVQTAGTWQVSVTVEKQGRIIGAAQLNFTAR